MYGLFQISLSLLFTPLFWTHIFQFPPYRPFEILFAGVFRVPFAFLMATSLITVYYGFCKFSLVTIHSTLWILFLDRYIPSYKRFTEATWWLVLARLSFSVYLIHLHTMVFVTSQVFDMRVPPSIFGLVSTDICLQFAWILFYPYRFHTSLYMKV